MGTTLSPFTGFGQYTKEDLQFAASLPKLESLWFTSLCKPLEYGTFDNNVPVEARFRIMLFPVVESFTEEEIFATNLREYPAGDAWALFRERFRRSVSQETALLDAFKEAMIPLSSETVDVDEAFITWADIIVSKFNGPLGYFFYHKDFQMSDDLKAALADTAMQDSSGWFIALAPHVFLENSLEIKYSDKAYSLGEARPEDDEAIIETFLGLWLPHPHLTPTEIFIASRAILDRNLKK